MQKTRNSRARTSGVNERPSHAERYFAQAQAIAHLIDKSLFESLATGLVVRVRRRGGRLFLLGVGGSAANCAHVVNDLRTRCDIEAYSPTDNVAELTARINDDGWDGVVCRLAASQLAGAEGRTDDLFGRGVDRKRGMSVNLMQAIEYARKRRASVFGIVGRDGG